MFAVLFEVRPGEGKRDAYLALAKEMKPILESIDGFIDNERFESRMRPGWVLSLSTWRDEKSVIRWRTQAKHHLTQATGRSDIFADYHLRVAEVAADTHPPIDLRAHRFDVTETGRSKFCTVTEVVFPPDPGREADTEALLRTLGLGHAPPGLNEVELYDSIYDPGKVLALGSWAEAAPAEGFRPGAVPHAESVRCRVVRVIRDYGMYDRRETPQYHAEVRRKGALSLDTPTPRS